MVRIITIQSFVVDQIIIFIDYIVITHHPQSDITLAKGNMLLLSVTADGPGRKKFKYQWKKRGSSISLPNRVKGKKTSNITISSVTPSDSGSYYCVVTNQWGNMTESNNSSVNVLRKSYISLTLYMLTCVPLLKQISYVILKAVTYVTEPAKMDQVGTNYT